MQLNFKPWTKEGIKEKERLQKLNVNKNEISENEDKEYSDNESV